MWKQFRHNLHAIISSVLLPVFLLPFAFSATEGYKFKNIFSNTDKITVNQTHRFRFTFSIEIDRLLRFCQKIELVFVIFINNGAMSSFRGSCFFVETNLIFQSTSNGVIPIMKIIGITFITQLISDVCRDNGFNAAASQLEIMCKIAVATISIPIVLSLMEMINKCIK